MHLIPKLSLSFLLTVFEFLSLGFFSLIPLSEILSQYFTAPNPPLTHGDDAGSSVTHAVQILGWSTFGWVIWFLYIGLLFVIAVNYLVVFIEEISLITYFPNKRSLIHFNEKKFCKKFGKNFVLLVVLLPLAMLVVFLLLIWDMYVMISKVYGLEPNDTTVTPYVSLVEVALFFGDVLFWKHLLMKWISLKTLNLNVSLFMEGHTHLFNEELLEEQLKKLLGIQSHH